MRIESDCECADVLLFVCPSNFVLLGILPTTQHQSVHSTQRFNVSTPIVFRFCVCDSNASFSFRPIADPVLRQQYDSGLPFDDSIPSASEVDISRPEAFFETFEPVFNRNAR